MRVYSGGKLEPLVLGLFLLEVLFYGGPLGFDDAVEQAIAVISTGFYALISDDSFQGCAHFFQGILRSEIGGIGSKLNSDGMQGFEAERQQQQFGFSVDT